MNMVKKNSYACYFLLENNFKVKTKEILACKNQIPPKKDEKYKNIAAKPLEQVNDYILSRKDQAHDQKIVEQIVKFLEGEINDTPFW